MIWLVYGLAALGLIPASFIVAFAVAIVYIANTGGLDYPGDHVGVLGKGCQKGRKGGGGRSQPRHG